MYRVVTSTLHSFLSPFLWPLVFLVFFFSFFLFTLSPCFVFVRGYRLEGGGNGWRKLEGDDGAKTRWTAGEDKFERREEHSSYDAYILTGIQILLPTDEPILLREFYKPLKSHEEESKLLFFDRTSFDRKSMDKTYFNKRVSGLSKKNCTLFYCNETNEIFLIKRYIKMLPGFINFFLTN